MARERGRERTQSTHSKANAMATRAVKVKVCGITSWRDARFACEAGADLVGFNFYRRSPRYVDPARARVIVRRLPEKVASVGIFVNEPEDKLIRTARLVGTQYVQLHGDETPAAVSRLRRALGAVKIIKAVRVRNASCIKKAGRFRCADAILLDGFDGRRFGGAGKKFDWSLAARANGRTRIFLAGGLTPENITEAIRTVRPYAIDVCSGVESSPGKKDPAKVRAMLEAVRGSKAERRNK